MDMHVAISKNKDGSVELYFVRIGHWDDFNLILGLLQQENGCIIVSNRDIVYFREAKITLNNFNFSLRHDDMLGNYLYTNDPEDVPELEKIANNIVNSIKTKLGNARN